MQWQCIHAPSGDALPEAGAPTWTYGAALWLTRRNCENALMKALLGLALIAALGSSCIIVPRHHRFHRAAVVRQDCPPAHHWNGNACVHNGRGHGHNKHRR